MLTCFAASVDEAEHFCRHRLRQQVIPQTVLHRDALVDHALRVFSLTCANLQDEKTRLGTQGKVPPLPGNLRLTLSDSALSA